MLILNEENARELSMSQMDNIDFLFYRGDYISYFPMASRTEEKFTGYYNYLCSNGDCDCIDELPINTDVYICPNGMKTKYKRTSDNLINIQNLVIDIDSHDKNVSIEEIHNQISNIIPKLINHLSIKPNFINETGRGLQLWYCIEPCHVSLKKVCINAITMICDDIEKVLKDETLLKIDKASSSKLSGLFRFPYSYNTKSKTWSKCQLIHKQTPNINTIISTLSENGYNRKKIGNYKTKSKSKRNYKFTTCAKTNKYTPCLIHRKRFLEYLTETRNMVDGSKRDLIMFYMYATVIRLYEPEAAKEYCLNLNDNFAEPLAYGQMCSIFKEVDKKHHIVFVKNLFNYIEATETERQWFYKSSKEHKKEEKRKQKEDKYNKVKEAYANGMTVTEISRTFNISRPTIYKITKGMD